MHLVGFHYKNVPRCRSSEFQINILTYVIITVI